MLPFKGQMKFLQFCKTKPNKFSSNCPWFWKTVQVTSVVFLSTQVKVQMNLLPKKGTLYPDCTGTTKTVMGLLQKTNLLDKHCTVYFDNWFSSQELLDELRYCDTYTAFH